MYLQPMSISADIYSWIDENGVKHFANEPPADVQGTEQRPEHIQGKEIYQKQDEDRQRKWDEMMGKVPVGSDRRVTKNPGEVIMYSRDACRKCEEARQFFNEYNIKFTEYNIDKDVEAKKRFIAFYGENVPTMTIFIGKRRFRTFYAPHIIGLFGIEYHNPTKIRHKIIRKKD